MDWWAIHHLMQWPLLLIQFLSNVCTRGKCLAVPRKQSINQSSSLTTGQPYNNILVLIADTKTNNYHDHFQLSEASEEHLKGKRSVAGIQDPGIKAHAGRIALVQPSPAPNQTSAIIDQVFKNRKNYPQTVYCFQSENTCIHNIPWWVQDIIILRAVSQGPGINIGDAGAQNTWKSFPIYSVNAFRVCFFY